RDNVYDGRLGNRDWNAIRAKYAAVAATPDVEALALICNLMTGELNGSHLGFTARNRGGAPQGPPAMPPGAPPAPPGTPGAPAAPEPSASWRPSTVHLGVRFDPKFAGPGWKVKDVIPDGPATRERSKLAAGDVVFQVEGKPVGPNVDPTLHLNVPADREVALLVKDAAGKERTVSIRPVSYAAVGPLLYEEWLKKNRKAVETASGGEVGYLYIRGMDWPSFQRLEEELCSVGTGRKGLIIDVRENGGGSTADHLLTVLCQPRHAFTVPRGGGTGYPGDRIVYATWNKPIVVLCNQNSFSNAEIFSHAIKVLKRGALVGVPTAGGVISTGAAPVMDVGQVRLPFRGWFNPLTGEDMELNGAVPDIVLWPEPADTAAGKDRQLETAVAEIKKAIAAPQASATVKPKYASERTDAGGQ
ncbi:MAG TPA: S41 family peptidase, partial [Planctomycetia bacterium]|nr:S41 family peptidase [Planctomycetia bacterium]